MSEEIIITMVTEKLVINEMTDRERKIYDAGYDKGFSEGKETKYKMYWLGIIGIISIGYFFIKILFMVM